MAEKDNEAWTNFLFFVGFIVLILWLFAGR